MRPRNRPRRDRTPDFAARTLGQPMQKAPEYCTPGFSSANAAKLEPAAGNNVAAKVEFPRRDRNRMRSLLLLLERAGVGHDGTQEERGAADNVAKDGAQGNIKTLVAARDTRERRARLAGRGVQADQRKENRRVAQTFGGAQQAPQVRRLSFGAVDADVLYQSRREKPAPNPTRPPPAREGGAEASVRAGMIARHVVIPGVRATLRLVIPA